MASFVAAVSIIGPDVVRDFRQPTQRLLVRLKRGGGTICRPAARRGSEGESDAYVMYFFPKYLVEQFDMACTICYTNFWGGKAEQSSSEVNTPKKITFAIVYIL